MTNTQTLPLKISAYLGVSLKIILTAFLARLMLDISTRILFPFIPQFSTGVGLTVIGFSWLMFIRSLAGMSSPIFGMLSDRYGRRILMMGALLLQTIGAGGLIIFKQWWAILPIIISGLSVAAFYPSQQAYISEQALPSRRGRALAIVESSWSLVGIIILPITGLMIDKIGWQSPFLVLSFLCLISTGVLWRQLPPVQTRRVSELSWVQTRTIFLKSNVLASVGAVTLIFIPLSALITIWGIWLSANFAFSAVTIGLVGTGIGLAELTGVITSGLIIDRVGKKRSGLTGLLLLMGSFVLLPFTQNTLLPALILLIAMGTFYEFLIVSMIPVYAEQVPSAPGTVLSLVVVGGGIGGAIGPPIATNLWALTGDLKSISIVAVLSLVIAFGLIKKFLHG